MDVTKAENTQKIKDHTYFTTAREDGQKCPVSVSDEGEFKQRSAPFFAYNKQNYQAKLNLAMEEPFANGLLEFFVSEMDNTNAICVSMKVLERIFKTTRQTIKTHINILVARKFVEIFKVGNMNAYAINALVVFTQGDANIWKAKFKATMYLDYNEQSVKIKKEYSKQIKIK